MGEFRNKWKLICTVEAPRRNTKMRTRLSKSQSLKACSFLTRSTTRYLKLLLYVEKRRTWFTAGSQTCRKVSQSCKSTSSSWRERLWRLRRDSTTTWSCSTRTLQRIWISSKRSLQSSRLSNSRCRITFHRLKLLRVGSKIASLACELPLTPLTLSASRWTRFWKNSGKT